jgi:hypothetical protein
MVLFGLLLVVHGLIHLLGFVKAFRLADLPQLTQPISPLYGVLWLSAGVLFVCTAIALAVWPRWWWITSALAVAISTIAILPSWQDAKVGAYVNAVVVIATIVRYASADSR